MWFIATSISIGGFLSLKAYKHRNRIYYSIRTIGLWGTIYMTYNLYVASIRDSISTLLDIGNVSMYEDCYTISYWRGVNVYKVRVPKHRVVNGIRTITHSGEDVTKDVKMYMGVLNDFHGIPTTPRSLGYPNGLMFDMMFGDSKFFEPDVVIKM